MRATVAESLERIPTADGRRFASVFSHGTLRVEFYAPRGEDAPTPHTRDENYVVISGTGKFLNGGSRRPFGPEGGEAGQSA